MRPQQTDYPQYFESYISLVTGDDVHSILTSSIMDLKNALAAIPDTKADYAYAPGKWTIKQALQHCIDTERIFAYRALCLARSEQQPLPGFDQELYAGQANVENKPLQFLKDEMLLVRQSTEMLFKHFEDKELSKAGMVSNNKITVLAMGYTIIGHWLHHQSILKEKYLQ